MGQFHILQLVEICQIKEISFPTSAKFCGPQITLVSKENISTKTKLFKGNISEERL